MLVTAIRYFIVVFLGLFTGAMLLIAVSLVPYWQALSPEAFRLNFQALGPFLGQVMVPLMLLSIGLTVVNLLLTKEGRGRWTPPFLLVVGIVPLYALIHGPVNALLLGESVQSASEIGALRSSWFFWHWVRTVLGSGAFLLSLRNLYRSS